MFGGTRHNDLSQIRGRRDEIIAKRLSPGGVVWLWLGFHAATASILSPEASETNRIVGESPELLLDYGFDGRSAEVAVPGSQFRAELA
jgi:hypothetical protein